LFCIQNISNNSNGLKIRTEIYVLTLKRLFDYLYANRVKKEELESLV